MYSLNVVVNTLAQIIFWGSFAILLYVYVGYPLLVHAVGRAFGKPVRRAIIEPTVTIIVTAYNEERNIRSKIQNTLLIDYPKEKLQIIVASDGSTDSTEDIVREFSGAVELYRQDGRVGKTATQNAAVECAIGEIILFSDATTIYQSQVLRAILPNFYDETVGCVAGKLIYVDDSSSGVGAGAKNYWSYETFLKESESRACSLIGVSGCLYAVRRSAYTPMYAEACSDFLIATLLYKNRLRTIYEPLAVCTEMTNRETGSEMRMRTRIISQTFTDLWRNREMLNPLHAGFYSVELFSHKVLRYAVPLFLMLILVSSAFLSISSSFHAVLFVCQIAFYFTALAGWLLEKDGRKIGLFALPLYFVLANLASVFGFYKFIIGERYSSWEPIRSS